MKPYRRIYDSLRTAAFSLTLCFVAVSCVDDASLCPEDLPGYNPENNVWLTLDIVNPTMQGTPRTPSRAGDPDDSLLHPSEGATAAENYIDPTDISLNLFDQNGYTMKTLTSSDFTVKALDNGNKTYRVTAKVNRAYFDFAGESGKMSILAVANTRGINRSDLTTSNYDVVQFQQSLDDLTGQLRAFGYDGLIAGGSAAPWQPDIAAGRHIPMAGYEHTAIDISALDRADSETNAMPLGSITMQRAMAKIRILDGIRLQNDLDSPTEIVSVNFCSGSAKGAYVPSTAQIPQWRRGTTTVENATIPVPAGAWNSKTLLQPSFQTLFPASDASGVTRNYTSFDCYVAESPLLALRPTDLRPYLRIVIQNKAAITKSYTVYLDEWIATINRTPDIARNHIYQFTVTLSEKSKIKLDYTVCQWNNVTAGDINFN